MDGSCVLAWRMLFDASPEVVTTYFRSLLQTPDGYSELCVFGRPLSKTSGVPEAGDVRLILPLPPVLTIIDVLVSKALSSWNSNYFTIPRGVFVGNRPGCQCLDVTAGVSLALEKSMDDGCRTCAAQADIKQYYDSLQPLQIAKFLLAAGCPAWIATACVWMQTLTPVQFLFDHIRSPLPARLTGTLTGTRTAGMLGETVMLDILLAATADRLFRPLQLSDERLFISSWVDNLFVVAGSTMDAIANLEIVERIAEEKWSLSFKPTSMSYVTASGLPNPNISARWLFTPAFKTLGHIISHDGSCDKDVDAAIKAAWGRFWSGPGSKKGKTLPTKLKLRDVNRCCRPAVSYRCSWWQWSRSIAKRLDRAQRLIVCACLGFRMRPNEVWEDFVRRRARAAAFECKHNLWSQHACSRIVSWYSHAKRNHCASWPGQIFPFHDDLWLRDRRKQCNSPSIFAGKTGTRLKRGPPRIRFETGLELAREVAEECP